MEEKIKILYQKVKKIVEGYLIGQERNNIEQMRTIIPQLQEYVLWFIEDNRLNIDDKDYQELKKNLILILKDILMAMEQEDRVLLNDALAFDLIAYFKMNESIVEE
ncbi:MAG: hypothetical protein OSJ62_06625 [Lachnospiraceae bacterium]|nr:hypothetical protein [Lachnospiraceae bacterium]